VFSGIPIRFPGLKISLTEGGVDWVPYVVARLDSIGHEHLRGTWTHQDVVPSEAFLHTFWFSALFDVAAYDFLANACPDHVMIETDFPHSDTTWPDSRAHFSRRLAGLAPDIRQKFTIDNAAALYRHPLPAHLPPA
jgi:hypothetical protein